MATVNGDEDARLPNTPPHQVFMSCHCLVIVIVLSLSWLCLVIVLSCLCLVVSCRVVSCCVVSCHVVSCLGLPWERLGREHERKRMCDAPESGIWGEERETSKVWLRGRGDTVE
jgi:hypothetical protein